MTTLYVTDLDGTLLNDRAQLSPVSRALLAPLIEAGLCFTYATARSQASASRCLGALTPRLSVIAYNGCLLADPVTGEALELQRFDPEVLALLAGLLLKRAIVPVCYAMLEGRERVSHLVGRESAGVLEYLSARAGDRRLRPVHSEQALFEGAAYYMTCISERAALEEALACLDGMRLPVVRTLQLDRYQNRYWLEIMPAGATKAQGVARLRARLKADRVVCFGDAINDLSLFEVADVSYAVQNAAPELKARATRVLSGTNEQDAVARALDRLARGLEPEA